MTAATTISGIYGELRGYRRIRIRRVVATAAHGPADRLRELSEQRFQHHVRRCLDRFPAYAEIVKAHRGSLPRADEVVRAEELPVWTRPMQREFFAHQEHPPDSAYVHQTSGSTGMPVRFHVTRESYEWRTAVMDRSYSWAGAEEGRRSIHLWAADQKRPAAAQRAKRFAHLVLQRRHYFDAFQQMGDAERAQCCALINRVRPRSIVGYTSMMVDLARFVRDHPGVMTWKAKTMVSAAEGLDPSQRRLLESHVVDEVFMSYGSREFMSIGMECERHDGYHLASDNLRVEVVGDDGAPVPPGETGRVAITDFHNAATPFVRYEIGDLGVMMRDSPCACGRPFPRLRSVEGRLQDTVVTPGGNRVTGLYVTYTMRQFDFIDGYQVVQHSPQRITVRLLTRDELTGEKTAPVEALLRKKLGDEMAIEFERAVALERRPSGKVDLVISRMS